MDLSGKHRKVLEQLLRKPTPRNINWSDVESLLIYFGLSLTEGSGSRVKFHLGDSKFYTHRPHPQKEAKPYQLKELIIFLRRIGIIEEEGL